MKIKMNTNFHMHIETPKNVFYELFFSDMTQHYSPMSDFKMCTISVIFRSVTYKWSGQLSHHTSFVMFLPSRVIHTSPAVPKCNEHYFADQSNLYQSKLPMSVSYTTFRPMDEVQPVPMSVIWAVVSVLYLYDFLTSYKN